LPLLVVPLRSRSDYALLRIIIAIIEGMKADKEKRIDLVRLETALLRYSKNFLKKRKTMTILS